MHVAGTQEGKKQIRDPDGKKVSIRKLSDNYQLGDP
jgi:hypothetical protein